MTICTHVSCIERSKVMNVLDQHTLQNNLVTRVCEINIIRHLVKQLINKGVIGILPSN